MRSLDLVADRLERPCSSVSRSPALELGRSAVPGTRAGPSLKSAVRDESSSANASPSIASTSAVSSERWMQRLVSPIATVGAAASWPTSAVAVASSSASGTARWMSPQSAASAPESLRPSSSSSLARATPTRRGSSQVAPLSALKPRSRNGSQKRPYSVAIVKSAASASWKPSPAAQPRTAQTTGQLELGEQLDQAVRLQRRAALEAAGPRSRRVPAPGALVATQSAPEQKSVPVLPMHDRRAASRRWRPPRAPRRCAGPRRCRASSCAPAGPA